MTSSLVSPYPLAHAETRDLQKLCQALWKWEACPDCPKSSQCANRTCAWKRFPKLEAFFQHYRQLTSSYVPELLPGSKPALQSHDDLFAIIRILQSQPHEIRAELTHQHFASKAGTGALPPIADQNRAVNLAVKTMTMVTCSVENQPAGLLELGMQPLPWHNSSSFTSFLTKAFPRADRGTLNFKYDSGKMRDPKSAITARRLRKIAKLRFHGTDDLRNHLKLDTKNGVVEVYHYTSVLKEHLRAPRSGSAGARENNLLNQVALEALHSLQMILFPFDTDSEFILRNLASKQAFDPDCLDYDYLFGENYDENGISYSYFGARLMELHEEIENPSPRGFVEKWLQRKSGARYVMLATLVGVCIAVVLGILSLATGVIQTWIAYEAWKYPHDG